MSEHPLELEEVSIDYDSNRVVDRVSLQVNRGEFVSVLGRSGCGKTSLLRTIAGLKEPATGVLKIAGRVVANSKDIFVPAERRNVGLLFQDYALFPYQTVMENVSFGVTPDRFRRVDELLDVVGMSAFRDRKPSELSGGQQQRVALARALAPGPEILLLDEPFANVDVALRQALSAELARVIRSTGTTVVLVTHDRDEALSLADRVIVLSTADAASTIGQVGSPCEVYERPADADVALAIGPGLIVDGKADGGSAKTPLGSVALVEPRSGSCQVLVRPEALDFKPLAGGDCTVTERTFHGAEGWRLHVRTPTGLVIVPVRTPVDVGTSGRVDVCRPCWSF